MILSDDELKMVEDLAGANYSPEKIALYLQVEKTAFLKEWYQLGSDVRQAYDRGRLVAEFSINQKQLELAKSGNITAAQVYFKEAERLRVEEIRNRILFGE
ncbi:hypothetical protein [Flavobacterium psychrotrophum]|uniref:hypothetical protein n=1 Tax=Flavobacterium psychrotrophum TaxID=2294119 RepID=UPI000E3211FE|nr:hypothetical protein [Flavobacterium psychrotrophum]